MTSRLSLKDLTRFLFEVGEKKEKEEGNDSLDAQVDKYLVDYEKDSKNAKNEGKDFRTTVRRFLSEAEEGEGGDEDAAEGDETKKLTEDDIDIKNFLVDVMRLVDNYDALLDVRNTILTRAVNFLLKGYEPGVANSFKEMLMDDYGMEIGKSKADVEDEKYQTTPADRAGPPPPA